MKRFDWGLQEVVGRIQPIPLWAFKRLQLPSTPLCPSPCSWTCSAGGAFEADASNGPWRGATLSAVGAGRACAPGTTCKLRITGGGAAPAQLGARGRAPRRRPAPLAARASGAPRASAPAALLSQRVDRWPARLAPRRPRRRDEIQRRPGLRIRRGHGPRAGLPGRHLPRVLHRRRRRRRPRGAGRARPAARAQRLRQRRRKPLDQRDGRARGGAARRVPLPAGTLLFTVPRRPLRGAVHPGARGPWGGGGLAAARRVLVCRAAGPPAQAGSGGGGPRGPCPPAATRPDSPETLAAAAPPSPHAVPRL
jgi:hypothetical protein